MGKNVEQKDKVGKKRWTIEQILIAEINCILRRNKNEKFLRMLLTRATILEELNL